MINEKELRNKIADQVAKWLETGGRDSELLEFIREYKSEDNHLRNFLQKTFREEDRETIMDRLTAMYYGSEVSRDYPSGEVICIHGPPATGKTMLAQAILLMFHKTSMEMHTDFLTEKWPTMPDLGSRKVIVVDEYCKLVHSKAENHLKYLKDQGHLVFVFSSEPMSFTEDFYVIETKVTKPLGSDYLSNREMLIDTLRAYRQAQL